MKLMDSPSNFLRKAEAASTRDVLVTYLLCSIHPFWRQSLADTNCSLWIQADSRHQGHAIIGNLSTRQTCSQCSLPTHQTNISAFRLHIIFSVFGPWALLLKSFHVPLPSFNLINLYTGLMVSMHTIRFTAQNMLYNTNHQQLIYSPQFQDQWTRTEMTNVKNNQVINCAPHTSQGRHIL